MKPTEEEMREACDKFLGTKGYYHPQDDIARDVWKAACEWMVSRE